MNYEFSKYYFALIIIILYSSLLSAQDKSEVKNYFMLPHQIVQSEFRHAISIASATLPEDYVEESSDFLKSPLFGYSALYGLQNNFILNGNVSTNIITWQFSAGAKWNFSVDKFSFALGYDLAFVYGQLKKFGFNSSIKSWINFPNLTVGYEFDKFAISFLTEAIIVSSLTEYTDDIEISNTSNRFAGMAFTGVIEQPLWNDNYLSIGIKFNYTKFYYPTWAAYSKFDIYYWIPEFKVWLVL